MNPSTEGGRIGLKHCVRDTRGEGWALEIDSHHLQILGQKEKLLVIVTPSWLLTAVD